MNYYEILEISETASNDEIKKSYKKLVKKYHPDVFDGDKKTADEKIKALNEAYETLSDPELKKAYDEVLFAAPTQTFDFSSSQSNYSDIKAEPSPQEKYEDLYRYNYYKKYTTNYYGISRDDLKKDTYTNKKKTEETISSSVRFKLIITIGISTVILLILLIILLYYLRLALKDPFEDQTFSNINFNTRLPHIDFGMTYDEVKELIGSPNFVEDKKGNLYAYWGNSYIIFDKNDILIGWHNYGDYFYTETVTGEDFTELQEFYNAFEQEFSDF